MFSAEHFHMFLKTLHSHRVRYNKFLKDNGFSKAPVTPLPQIVLIGMHCLELEGHQHAGIAQHWIKLKACLRVGLLYVLSFACACSVVCAVYYQYMVSAGMQAPLVVMVALPHSSACPGSNSLVHMRR